MPTLSERRGEGKHLRDLVRVFMQDNGEMCAHFTFVSRSFVCDCRNMTKCPLTRGVRLQEVSISGGSTVSNERFNLLIVTLSNNFT